MELPRLPTTGSPSSDHVRIAFSFQILAVSIYAANFQRLNKNDSTAVSTSSIGRVLLNNRIYQLRQTMPPKSFAPLTPAEREQKPNRYGIWIRYGTRYTVGARC
jgi:hypothetical protein